MNRNMMERFSEACGAAGPLLVDVHDDGDVHRARRIFHQPFLICGRHPGADLELRHERVSRRHCYLQTVGGRIFSIDLGTRAGIRVDGTACRTGWLDDGREFRLGPVGLRVRGGDRREHAPALESPSPLSSRYASEQSLPEVALEIGNGAGRVQSWPLSRVLVLIGRSAGCKLRLLSPLVSEFHCALLRTESGVWLIDLLSQGGVYVDGVATRVACLAAGAEFWIGPFVIRLRPGRGGNGAPAMEARVSSRQSMDLGLSEDGRERPCVEAEPSSDPLERPSKFSAPAEPTASMPDQLRQILMMSRILAAMHRDHQDALRQEIRELRGLAEELRTMRSELSSRQVAGLEGWSELESGPAEVGRSDTGDFDWQEELQLILKTVNADRAHSSDRSKGLIHAYAHGRFAGSRSRAEGTRPPERDPRIVHAIASEFLFAYRLERQGLRERFMRALLGPHDATDMLHRSR